MKLKDVIIHKYKSIETEQKFDVEKDITILVGMNESGKTSVLEALAKSNYFQKDPKFEYNTTHDYPRKEKKALDKSKADPDAITCTYSISEELQNKIASDIGENVFELKEFKITHKYSKKRVLSDIQLDTDKFIKIKTDKLSITSKTLNDKISAVKSTTHLETLIGEYKDDNIVAGLKTLKKYFANKMEWENNPLGEYIARTYLLPNLPKFLYYDEYYALPSRINIESLQNEDLKEEEQKTAKALFDLADINIEELLKAENYEDFKAELEATQATITNELFTYWGTNKNLEIIFDIDKVEGEIERQVSDNYGRNTTVKDVKVIQHVLDIRVKNTRSGVSLPLKNRSKGFNWFFSFLVWFKKIQEDKTSNYILLLDEPGLNLHAAAQKNLLQFLSDLSQNYQIIYSTHSPFMIESDDLHKVRTVLETDNGTVISNSIQEKDPNTLFPLQAALGYDIAQNLFISKFNLLVEGVSDLVYLQIMSSILHSIGRIGLDEKITIVPTGGLDKVSTFISLLRGSELNIACLLDTFKDGKLNDLIDQKIIHKNRIKFFDEFLDGYSHADIEDLFAKEDYIKIYNDAFPEKPVKIEDLNNDIKPTLIQINKFLGIDRFNHYRPANKLASKGVDSAFFSNVSIDNFEKVFKAINKLFL